MNAIDLEIYRHLFASVAEEMGHRLMRSAYSPNIKERRDFSCALFDPQGEMIAQAAHIPVHLGATPMSVQAALRAFDFNRPEHHNTIVVLNDPYDGGTHLPDITMVAPCFVAGHEGPAFFVANRAHHADVGGISAGSMPMSTHIDQEGIRIPPTELTDATFRTICDASRTPDERAGDLAAQKAAVHLGLERLQSLCAARGTNQVLLAASALQDYAERLMRAFVQDIPDGTYVGEDVMDSSGFGATHIPIVCRLSVAGSEATFDFSESATQVEGPINAVRAITVSAVNYVMRCMAGSALPTNGGLMRPVRVVTRPGTICDASYPAAVAAGNVEASQRLVDVVFHALSKALPGQVPAASCGSMNNVTIGGEDPRTGAAFAYYETIAGGAGASALGPGRSGVHTHMTNTLNTPVEALEHAYPLTIERYALQDAEPLTTNHQHRGGRGVVRTYGFLEEAEVTLLTERRLLSPPGRNGGEDGTKGANTLIEADGTRIALPAKVTRVFQPGEQLEIATPGGGSFGVESS